MVRYSDDSESRAHIIGKSYNTTRAKITGRQPFTVDEAMKIKENLFPSYSVEYLFSTKESET